MFLEILISLTVLFLTVRWFLRGLKVRYYGNKHIFITGCDTGFGNLLAKRLDGLGFRVYAGCLTGKGMKELKAACSNHLTTIEIDVTNDASIHKAKQEVEKKLPKGKGKLVYSYSDYVLKFKFTPYVRIRADGNKAVFSCPIVSS